MTELPCRARLLGEARHPARVGGVRMRDELDRDVAMQAWVMRAVDITHAAGPEPRDDSKRPTVVPIATGGVPSSSDEDLGREPGASGGRVTAPPHARKRRWRMLSAALIANRAVVPVSVGPGQVVRNFGAHTSNDGGHHPPTAGAGRPVLHLPPTGRAEHSRGKALDVVGTSAARCVENARW